MFAAHLHVEEGSGAQRSARRRFQECNGCTLHSRHCCNAHVMESSSLNHDMMMTCMLLTLQSLLRRYRPRRPGSLAERNPMQFGLCDFTKSGIDCDMTCMLLAPQSLSRRYRPRRAGSPHGRSPRRTVQRPSPPHATLPGIPWPPFARASLTAWPLSTR